MGNRQLTFSWTFNCATPEAEAAAKKMFENMARGAYVETYATTEPVNQLVATGEYKGSLNNLKIEATGSYSEK